MKFIFIFFLFISINASSQNYSSSIVGSSIIEVITATEDQALNFGAFSPINNGRIIITPYGDRIFEGSIGFKNKKHNPGSFTITGQDGSMFSINLPSNPIVIYNGEKYLSVTNWNAIPDDKIFENGLCIVNIGATLNIDLLSSNVSKGNYTGEYSITFDYY